MEQPSGPAEEGTLDTDTNERPHGYIHGSSPLQRKRIDIRDRRGVVPPNTSTMSPTIASGLSQRFENQALELKEDDDNKRIKPRGIWGNMYDYRNQSAKVDPACSIRFVAFATLFPELLYM